MKILIIRFSSIGDIVLTTPAIRCIKQQIPACEVHFLTKSSFHTVLANNPYIDKLHFLKKPLAVTLDDLRAEHFDYVIDLHNNIRTRIIKFKLGVKSSAFDKLNFRKWLLVNLKVDIMPEKHIVDRYIETASFLGVKNDGKGLDYFLEEEHDLTVLLPQSHQQYTGLVIGAQHATKRLPTHKLIEVCQRIKSPVVLLGGKEDKERGAEIASASGVHVFNGCGKFTLDQSAFLVREAQLIITHDTGLMHIAAAFDKPITSVWGNTVPQLGMYPYKTGQLKIAEVKGLSCRPCSKIGYKKCPRGHFKCMNDQDIEAIASGF
ncbi:glycosyltransferase family 9 protein [Desertivirga xinjiangensis]|uniref:glycosyltransferase family 9 protein n=1 Tax=Desertivirga xinjiangensis TaxID=539206 RepID=UPI00210BDA7C|nr:glycosyltransferase family 9 protein [Pedobacter xinjiangensis]